MESALSMGKARMATHQSGRGPSNRTNAERHGFNYSVGLGQVNKKNFAKYGAKLLEQAFDPCTNLRVASAILKICYLRAKGGKATKQDSGRCAMRLAVTTPAISLRDIGLATSKRL